MLHNTSFLRHPQRQVIQNKKSPIFQWQFLTSGIGKLVASDFDELVKFGSSKA